MTTHDDTLVAMYPGGRGTDKTTMLVKQVCQAVREGQSVAVVVPTMHDSRRTDTLVHERLDAFETVVPCYSESTLVMGRSRGKRFDHIFIDDADRFEDAPAELVAHFHPGVSFTMTYTPTHDRVVDMDRRIRHQEEREKAYREQRRRDAEDAFMMAWMQRKVVEYSDD